MLASAKAKTKRLFPTLVFQRNTKPMTFFSEELNHLKEDLVEFLLAVFVSSSSSKILFITAYHEIGIEVKYKLPFFFGGGGVK